MAKKIHDLAETKGSFELRGVVSGVEKDSFYTNGNTNSGKEFRRVNFGVEYDKTKNWYLGLYGVERDKVYASRRGDNGIEVISFPWFERTNIDSQYSLIGKRIGLIKVLKNNKMVNDVKRLTEFDSCEYINDNLKDDMSIYIRGDIDFSHYNNDKDECVRKINYNLDQMYLAKDINFEDDNFTPLHAFNQRIIYMGISQEKDLENKPTGRFVLSAKIVKYNSIEDVEFIITDLSLAKLFKTKIKSSYVSIDVWGVLESIQLVEEKNIEDVWGSENTMQVAKSQHKMELIITGANPKSIDYDVYSKEKIDKALESIKQYHEAKFDFGVSNKETYESSWGTPMNVVSDGDTTFDDDESVWD